MTSTKETAESWEEDGHLFITKVKVAHGRPKTVCVRCWKPLSQCYEGQACESEKEGKWTPLGIESTLATLKEGDDREIIRVANDAAEIIEQLQNSTDLKRIAEAVEKLLVRERGRLPEEEPQALGSRGENMTQRDYDIPCKVCGQALTVQATGPAHWVMGCSPLEEDPKNTNHLRLKAGRKRAADEHYSKSRMEFGSYDAAREYGLQLTIVRLRSRLQEAMKQINALPAEFLPPEEEPSSTTEDEPYVNLNAVLKILKDEVVRKS